MPVNFFIDPKETFKIKVYIYEQDGNVVATVDLNEVPTGTEPQTATFEFKRANYKDSVDITGSSMMTKDEKVQLDVIKLQDTLFRKLIVGWDLKDEEGNAVIFTSKNIDALRPEIARVIAADLIVKSRLF